MSVDQIPSEKSHSSQREAKLVGYDEYIDTQIRHTRRMVKVVDLATALAVLATGALGYLLVAAVAENWLVPGGFGTLERSLLLAVLVLIAGQYAYRRLWPLLVRSINPVYAAQTIEQSSPSLKNSLMNLLLFRQRRDQITDAVYETLEEQAAHGLTRVPVDSAVDRTNLIRFGYALVAMVSLCAVYKMFSPKDPLIAVQRVLMPWADIVPASRVSITDVEPGTITLARGEMLPVSADVQGVGDDDPVVVRYTTADGQAVEKAVTMKGSGSGLHFTAQLPAAAEPGRPTGVSQNLRYRIEAGDARSHVYSVTVVAAPTITVERVDYEYPTYTGITNRSVDGLGDIRAIEGTRVTIHARANGPIKDAAIDFESDGRRDVRMTIDGNDAQASFGLALRDDHQTPKYKSYAVRFTGTDDRANRDPVKYPIDVLPDYAPEASILAPAEKVLDVRLDETVPIAVDARDPDFALSEVRLKGDASGRPVLDEPLLSKSFTGRFTGRLQFTPSEHGLKSGDVMRYWVTARDNRAPQANEVASEPQTLRIGSPDPNGQRPPDRVAQRERRPAQPGDQQQGPPQPGDGQGSEQAQPNDNSQASDGRQPGSAQPPSGANSREPQNGQQASDKSQGEQSQGDKSQADKSPSDKSQKNPSQDGSSSDKQSGSGQSPQEKQRSQGQGKDSQQQQPGGSESGGGHDKSQKQPGQPSGGSGESSDKNSQSGQSGSNGGSSGKQGDSKGQQQHEGTDGKGDRPSNKQDSHGDSSGKGSHESVKPSDSPSQVSPEGDNDGEAFDRIQKFLQQKGELRDPGENQKKPPSDQQSPGDKQGDQPGQSGNNNSASGKQSQADGKTSEQKPADGKTGDAKAPSENPKNADGNSSQQKKDGAQGDAKNQDASKSDQQGGQSSKDSRQNGQPGKNASGGDKDAGSMNKPGGEKQPSEQSAEKQNNPQTPNGQPAQSSGESGGGEATKHDQATPDTGGQPQPKDKWQQSPSKADDKKSSKGDEPSSGGQSKRESDSQGDQGGDQAGGGTQGSGQQSPHDGTGSSGQNQSADEGAGESSEHGKGHNSPSAGKDAESKDRTGQSGSNQPGNGSSQRDGQGNQPGGKQGGNPSDAKQPSGSSPNDKNSSTGKSNDGDKPGNPSDYKSAENGRGDNKANDGKQQGQQDQQDNPDGKSRGDQSTNKTQQQKGQPDGKQSDPANKGGGQSQPGDKSPAGSQSNQSGGNSGQSSNNGTPGTPHGAGGPNKTDATAPEADAANLDYARKQTDLVLETLAEQMKHKKVDKRLLDELGWSEQDLQKFIARWQQLKETARGDTPAADAAQKELDDALRSLGLHHGPLQQGKVTEDKVRDLHEGYHGPVPLEYQERLRAYNQGVSRARQDGE